MPNHHDILFRSTFAESDAAAWLVATALPELAGARELALVDTTGIAGGDLRQPDLIWEVDRSLRVRTAWQHQSTVDPRMDLRVLRDTAVLLTHWSSTDPGPLPALVTVVVTHAPRAWSAPRDVRERMADLTGALDRAVVRCPYTVLDLRDLTDAQRAGAPPIARVALALLVAWRTAGADLWEVFFDHAPELATILRARGQSAVHGFLRYLSRTSPTRPPEDVMARLATIDPDLAESYVTLADALFAEGEAAGRHAAARDLLLRLGAQRFGPATAAHRSALDALDTPALEALALRLLTAPTWDALLE